MSGAQGATAGPAPSRTQRNPLTWPTSAAVPHHVKAAVLLPQLPQPPGPGLPNCWGEEPALEPVSQL